MYIEKPLLGGGEVETSIFLSFHITFHSDPAFPESLLLLTLFRMQLDARICTISECLLDPPEARRQRRIH